MTELGKASAKADIQAQFDKATKEDDPNNVGGAGGAGDGGAGGVSGAGGDADPTGAPSFTSMTDAIFIEAAEATRLDPTIPPWGADEVAQQLADILRDFIRTGDAEEGIEMIRPALLMWARNRQAAVRRYHTDRANRGVEGFGGPSSFDTPTGREDVRLPGILDKYCLADTFDFEGRTLIVGKMTVDDWGKIAVRSEKQAAGNWATATRAREAMRIITVAGVTCLEEVV